MALSSANRCYDFPLAEPGQSKRRARFFLRGRTKTVRRRAGASDRFLDVYHGWIGALVLAEGLLNVIPSFVRG